MTKKKNEIIEEVNEVAEVTDIEVVEEVVEVPKKEFTLYPLKKSIKIGDEIKPIGYNIPLTKEGYKFYKQQNIV